MYKVDGLEIEVATQSGKAVNGLRALTASLKSLREVSKVSIPKKISDGIKTITDAIHGISMDDVVKIERLSYALQGMSGLKGAIGLDAKDVKGIENVSEAVDKAEEMTNSANAAGEKLTNMANGIENISQAERDWLNATLALNKPTLQFTNVMGRAFGALKGEVVKSLQPLKNFASSLKRIAGYRALRTIIKGITDGISTGLKNAYNYSVAMRDLGYQNDYLAASLDKISTKNQTFVNQVGSLAGELVQTVEPLISNILEKARNLFDTLSQITAAINGNTVYKKAVEAEKQWGEATDAAKEYKQQLLGIDEINNITTNTSSSNKNELDPTQMFEYAKVEANLLAIGKDLKNNFDDMLTAALGVYSTLKLWQFSSTFLASADEVVQVLGKIMRIAAGTVMIVIGVKLAYEAGKDLALGDDGIITKVKGVIANLATAMGGAVIGGTLFGVPGAVAGGVIGLTIGITATVVGYNSGLKEQAEADFWASDAGQYIQSIKNLVAENQEATSKLKIEIDAITGDIDPITMSKLETAKSLIDDIFGIDANKNLTSGQITVIKNKIELLNGLGLEGLNLTFDDAKGHVTQLKEEVYKVYDGLLEQYKIEALKNAIVEAFQKQYDAEVLVGQATDNVTTAQNAYNDALSKANEATAKVRKAQEKYNKVFDKIQVTFSNARDATRPYAEEIQALKVEMDAATAEEKKWKKAISASKTALDEAKSALGQANDTLKTANDKVGMLSGKFAELNTNASETSSAVNELKTALQDVSKTKIDLDQVIVGEVLGKGNNKHTSIAIGIEGRASGGYVNQGSLFYAGESGTEFIGDIGGQTAVANTDQMGQAIENASYRGMAKALAEFGGNTIKIEGDPQGMFRIIQQKSQEYFNINGEYAFM